jgi:hypothetical protein
MIPLYLLQRPYVLGVLVSRFGLIESNVYSPVHKACENEGEGHPPASKPLITQHVSTALLIMLF